MAIKKILRHRFIFPKRLNLLILGSLLVVFVVMGYTAYLNSGVSKPEVYQSSIVSDQVTIPISSPVDSPKVIVSTDPIEPCNGQKSKQTINVRRSECQSKYTDCQIGNVWKILTKDECSRQQVSNNGSNNTSYQPIPNQSGQLTINCSFSSGNYSFNFGQLTYDECKTKTDAYWASQTTTAPTSTSQKSAEEIAKCRSEVTAQYQSLISGCYVRYEGSAANQCASGYQGQSSVAMKACGT